MKRALMFCLLFTPFVGNAASTIPAMLSWHAPTKEIDGTTLRTAGITKHTVKCGLEKGKYTLEKVVAMPALHTTPDFAARGKNGYRYCVVTATNKDGEESAPSSEIRFYVHAGRIMADDPKRLANVQEK